jgi:leucyl-tRNA---protein transferase
MTNDSQLTELVIYDSEEKCPYLPGRRARMPLRMPTVPIGPSDTDRRLAMGERRSGSFVYRTACPSCLACEPIRIPVDSFTPSRSQRRVWKKASNAIDVEVGEVQVDEERVALFNKHRNYRGLCHDNLQVDASGMSAFLVDSCFRTFEMRYFFGEQLIGSAICDWGAESLSAVYCYFDPDFAYLSPGTFSVLRQIEWCREQALKYLYLGFYVADSEHMSYKAAYRPNERLLDGVWKTFT